MINRTYCRLPRASRRVVVLFVLLGCALLWPAADTPTRADAGYAVTWWSVQNTTALSSGDYQLVGTTATWTEDVLSHGGYQLVDANAAILSGFRPAPVEIGMEQIYLPMIEGR